MISPVRNAQSRQWNGAQNLKMPASYMQAIKTLMNGSNLLEKPRKNPTSKDLNKVQELLMTVHREDTECRLVSWTGNSKMYGRYTNRILPFTPESFWVSCSFVNETR